jgi:predicted nicotinamide N-methyase
LFSQRENDDGSVAMILLRQVFRGMIACYGPITLLQRHPQISTTTLSSSSSSSIPARTTPTTTAGPPFFLQSGDPVRARTIPIVDDANGGWNITIYEVDQLAAIVESYWDNAFIDGNDNDARSATNKKKNKKKKDVVVVRPRSQLDPFGLVAWPGAVVAARELQQVQQAKHGGVVLGKNVLVLGAGCGVEALAAAALGAASVLATDIHEQTLELLTLAATAAASKPSPWYDDDIRPTTTIATKIFDIADHAIPLPDIDQVDLLIIADVLYNDELAHHIAVRIEELLSYTRLHRRRSGRRHNNNKNNVRILVTDSQRFVANETLFPVDRWGAKWETRQLISFCGSGVALNEDQIYNVTARVLWITGGGGDDNDNGDMTEDMTAPTTATTDS